VASAESSAHINFKQRVVLTQEGETQLVLKKLTPVRLIKNAFYKLVEDAENRGADSQELVKILGKARAKKGMYEGDLNDGELEIGQVSALIQDIKPAAEIIQEIYTEFKRHIKKLNAYTT
jgi:enoyl-[acyl-carrier protein] reductase II